MVKAKSPKKTSSKSKSAKSSSQKTISSSSKTSSAINPIYWTPSKRSGKLFVFTGTSGAGKSTIASRVLNETNFFKKIVTCTTRSIRPGEVDGVDYHFFPIEKFQDLIKENAFLEYAIVYGNYYGSLRSEVDDAFKMGKSVLFVVDVQGALIIKKSFPDAVIIFFTAPSISVLRERLVKRGTDSNEVIEERLKLAQVELKLAKNFSHVIINDDLSTALSQTNKILIDALK